jgi:hypothetical protein
MLTRRQSDTYRPQSQHNETCFVAIRQSRDARRDPIVADPPRTIASRLAGTRGTFALRAG